MSKPSKKLLVVDGYDHAGLDGLERAGATQAGILYKHMLAIYVDVDRIDIVKLSTGNDPVIDLKSYGGVCWTGSNLFFTQSNQIVQRHIDLCLALFDAGIPQFGSCWAAQLAAVSAGGACGQNPKGREFGVARKITLAEAGKNHPLYRGKAQVFDGFTSHADIVTTLPTGATLLAGNQFSAVQALDVQHARGSFWAVQYHPEYDPGEIAALAVARQANLIKQGTFRDPRAAADYIEDMKALGRDPNRADIAWKHGVDQDVLDPDIRTLEVRNWLGHFFDI